MLCAPSLKAEHYIAQANFSDIHQTWTHEWDSVLRCRIRSRFFMFYIIWSDEKNSASMGQTVSLIIGTICEKKIVTFLRVISVAAL